MPSNIPACLRCGSALEGVSQAQLEEHVKEKRDIICGRCGASSRAKEWRDGPDSHSAPVSTSVPSDKVKEEDHASTSSKK